MLSPWFGSSTSSSAMPTCWTPAGMPMRWDFGSPHAQPSMVSDPKMPRIMVWRLPCAQ